MNYERTQKGNDLLKVTAKIEWFRRKYPKNVSRCLEFVGIYDDKAVIRILNKSIREAAKDGLGPRTTAKKILESKSPRKSLKIIKKNWQGILPLDKGKE